MYPSELLAIQCILALACLINFSTSARISLQYNLRHAIMELEDRRKGAISLLGFFLFLHC